MAVFDVAQTVVNGAAGVIVGNASIDITTAITDLEARLMEMELGPLFGLWFQSLFVGITMEVERMCDRLYELKEDAANSVVQSADLLKTTDELFEALEEIKYRLDR